MSAVILCLSISFELVYLNMFLIFALASVLLAVPPLHPNGASNRYKILSKLFPNPDKM